MGRKIQPARPFSLGIHVSSWRLKLIVIHGWGGSYSEALKRLGRMFDFRATWHAGGLLVERRTGLLVRQLLAQPEPGRLLAAVQKLLVGRLLAAQPDFETVVDFASDDGPFRFHEESLLRQFAHLGIPIAPGSRTRRSGVLIGEARQELADVLPVFDRLRLALEKADGSRLSERQSRETLREMAGGGERSVEVIELVDLVRSLQEGGGDLDTVASATLYAHWVIRSAMASGREAVYGRDYQFVFVNYHERLDALASYPQADVLMADLPIAAFPHFDEDARKLHAHGMHIERFEDHHPFTPGQKVMLDTLVADGVAGLVDLSGPVQGEELKASELRCGADMVYQNLVAGRAWDTAGARTLCRAAHAEDFVSDRNELGILLTDLIKGGACKAELAQTLLETMEPDNALDLLKKRGWDRITGAWNADHREAEPVLMENAYLIRIARPATPVAGQGGQALGSGSDVPIAVGAGSSDSGTIRILAGLAAGREAGRSRIPTGKAIEFYTRTFPDLDYVFYCYGSGLLVARRVNQADTSINLGALMPLIGGEGDGGHGGAAVCRPESNPDYPHALLGRVGDGGSFGRFVGYLGTRLERAGFEVQSTRNQSSPPRQELRKSGKRLGIITLIAVALGLLIVIFHPGFRRSEVVRSNRDFLPYLDIDADTVQPGPGSDSQP